MSNKINLKSYLNQYDFEYIIPSSNQKISFKPITTGQMKRLLMYEDEDMSTVEKILDDIITGCVTTEDFDIDELTIQDRFGLLIEIRKKSKGDIYSFQTKCGKCGLINPRSINLNDLPVKYIKKNVNHTVNLTESFSIELDYIRRRSQKQALEIVDNMKKKLTDAQKIAEVSMYTYALSITKFNTPDGEFTQKDVDIEDVVEMLSDLDETTYKKINDWFEENDYGVQFKTEFVCNNEKCNHKEEINIPVAYFFY